jgi:hypothetical protein
MKLLTAGRVTGVPKIYAYGRQKGIKFIFLLSFSRPNISASLVRYLVGGGIVADPDPGSGAFLTPGSGIGDG